MMMWRCNGCGAVFDEPLQYNPEEVPCISYDDFDLWGDFENMECCPDCYDVDVVCIREDDEDEDD